MNPSDTLFVCGLPGIGDVVANTRVLLRNPADWGERMDDGVWWDVAQLRRADGWGVRVRRRMLPAVNQSNDGSAIYGCGRGGMVNNKLC